MREFGKCLPDSATCLRKEHQDAKDNTSGNNVPEGQDAAALDDGDWRQGLRHHKLFSLDGKAGSLKFGSSLLAQREFGFFMRCDSGA